MSGPDPAPGGGRPGDGDARPATGDAHSAPGDARPALERVAAQDVDPAAREVLADAGWRRLHPVTPVLQGWKALAVVLALLVHQNLQHLLEADVPAWVVVAVLLGGLLLLALVSTGWGVLAWRRTRYRIDAEAVHVERGVLHRQQRRAQLDRLQAVDVVRPLLGRLFGLAELRLEVAGGGGAVQLAYLREDEAQRVRNALLAAAAGVGYSGEEAPEAPERPVLEVPVDRLLLSILRSGATVWVLLAVAGLVVAVVVVGSPAPLAAAVPALVGTAGAVWQRFSRGFGFSVAESPDGLRLRHGLLEHRSQTVPPGRVQALRISQPLLWRGADWWQVRVNVAGYGAGAGEGQGDATTVLPVGTREELARVLAVVLPDLGTRESPLEVVSAGLTGRDGDGGFVPAPRAARWLDPLGWRRHGFRVTERAFLARGGVLRRRLDVVPHERTQSLGMRQGPWQRRLGLASVQLHSTPGPVSPHVEHLAAPVAAVLLDEQAARARAARAAAGPERWMADGGAPASGGAAAGGTAE